jgi:hypothetical protein
MCVTHSVFHIYIGQNKQSRVDSSHTHKFKSAAHTTHLRKFGPIEPVGRIFRYTQLCHTHNALDKSAWSTVTVTVTPCITVTATARYNLLRYSSYRKAPPFPLSTWTVTLTMYIPMMSVTQVYSPECQTNRHPTHSHSHG